MFDQDALAGSGAGRPAHCCRRFLSGFCCSSHWLRHVAQYTPGSSQPYAGQIARQRSQMVLQDLGRLAPYQEGQDIIISMQLRQLVAARQKSIASHTKKLLKLAAELNAELANADSQAPTEAQLRKIAEIQKLAHSIRKDISVPITMPRNRMVPLLPAPFPPRRR